MVRECIPSSFYVQVILGLLKIWPKTASDKEVCESAHECVHARTHALVCWYLALYHRAVHCSRHSPNSQGLPEVFTNADTYLLAVPKEPLKPAKPFHRP